MSNTFRLFTTLGVGLMIWGFAMGLSSYLGEYFIRQNGGASATRGRSATSQSVAKLREAITKDSENASLHVELGYALIASVRGNKGGGEQLIEAIQSFNHALSLESEQPDALLGIAALSLRAGVVDKAVEFYPRYLAQVPDDYRAKSDYAFALIQIGKSEKAEKLLLEVLEKEENFFPALTAMAFKRREEGNLKEAKEYAERAADHVENPQAKQQVARFLESLETPREGLKQGAKGAEFLTKGSSLGNYFRAHPILGPKVVEIREDSQERAEVVVRDFPVEHMPEVAKMKFIQNVKLALQNQAPKEVTILDAQSGKELISISVGR